MIKIISGGQTGVDRAALDVALEFHMQCGGFCPRRRKSEDGVIPAKYPLRETVTEEYSERTELNVKAADATLVLIDQHADTGTVLTIELCKRYDKPLLQAHVSRADEDKQIVQWILQHKIEVLNIAGSRESSSRGIYLKAYQLLQKVVLTILERKLM